MGFLHSAPQCPFCPQLAHLLISFNSATVIRLLPAPRPDAEEAAVEGIDELPLLLMAPLRSFLKACFSFLFSLQVPFAFLPRLQTPPVPLLLPSPEEPILLDQLRFPLPISSTAFSFPEGLGHWLSSHI